MAQSTRSEVPPPAKPKQDPPWEPSIARVVAPILTPQERTALVLGDGVSCTGDPPVSAWQQLPAGLLPLTTGGGHDVTRARCRHQPGVPSQHAAVLHGHEDRDSQEDSCDGQGRVIRYLSKK